MTSFMSSQSFSQLLTINLQYNGIKITKQCSEPPYSVQMREKIRTRKELRTQTLSTKWSGLVVQKLKFVFVSTLRDKFISLI